MKKTRPIEDKILEEGFEITNLNYDCVSGIFTVSFRDPNRKGDEKYTLSEWAND